MVYCTVRVERGKGRMTAELVARGFGKNSKLEEESIIFLPLPFLLFSSLIHIIYWEEDTFSEFEQTMPKHDEVSIPRRTTRVSC
jgi:hypothetical protein